MKLISGNYGSVKAECTRIYSSGYFDFNFLYVSETEKFREIDRFLYESKHTLRYKNEYFGNVIIDVSEWNNKEPNVFFEAFMYFIKDNKDKYNCTFIVNEKSSHELIKKMEEFFGEIEEISFPFKQFNLKKKIGFIADSGKEEKDVRS